MSKGAEDLTGIDQASSIGRSSPLREADLAVENQSTQGGAGVDSFQSVYNQEMHTNDISKSVGVTDPVNEMSAGEIQSGAAVNFTGAQSVKEQLRESYGEMMEIRQMLVSAYDRLQREMM